MLLVAVVALIALTVLALLLAGVVAAIATGIALLNVLATVICMRSRSLRAVAPASAERWRPTSFRQPPEPSDERESERPTLTIHRR